MVTVDCEEASVRDLLIVFCRVAVQACCDAVDTALRLEPPHASSDALGWWGSSTMSSSCVQLCISDGFPPAVMVRSLEHGVV